MYAERLGLVPEQIVGKSITEILGKDASEIIRPHIQTVLNGETVKYETEIPYERIGRRFMHAAYVPEKDALRQRYGVGLGNQRNYRPQADGRDIAPTDSLPWKSSIRSFAN